MGKRGNGEGTIYQTQGGQWIAQATIHGRRKSLYGRTRREVRDKLRRVLADAEQGILPPPERQTVVEFLNRWLEDTKRRALKPRAYEHYRQMADYYILPELGPVRMGRLQPAHLQRLYASLLERGLSARTVHHVHAVLRNALGQALRWGDVHRNVAHLVAVPRVEKAEVEYLDRSQVAALLRSIAGDRWEALVALALGTGMHQSELLGLRWGDVELDAHRLHVRRQLNRDGSFTEPKSAKGRRTIALPPTLATLLAEHRRRQDEQRIWAGARWTESGLVFCTYAGRPLGHRNVLREFGRLVERAGLRHVSFHALRHTHATLLLQQGVPAKIVQERLGHGNIAMTLDTYSHFIPGMDADAAGTLDPLFG